MKIAYFAEIFPSPSETWVHHEIDALIEMGCEVRVFATRPRPATVPEEWEKLVNLTTYLTEIEKSLINGLRVFRSPNVILKVLAGMITDCHGLRHRVQVLRDIIIAGFFSRHLASYRPQFILAHFGGTRANLALITSMMTGTPFGIKFHAGDVFERVALLGLKVRRAAMLTAISRFNIGFMREHYPDVDMSRFKVHRCGLPIYEYPFQPKREFRRVPTIMAVGRLVPMKGFSVLLDASRQLLDRGCSHKITIHGDGPERRRLEQKVEDLGLERTVELMGYSTPDQVRIALLNADVFVLPAMFDSVGRTMDGIPVALMEAMAVGIPVVSTRLSGIPELIEHGVTGYLSVPGDSVALSEAILTWHGTNDADRTRMLLAARNKIEADHDAQKLSADLMRNLLERTRDQVGGQTCAE